MIYPPTINLLIRTNKHEELVPPRQVSGETRRDDCGDVSAFLEVVGIPLGSWQGAAPVRLGPCDVRGQGGSLRPAPVRSGENEGRPVGPCSDDQGVRGSLSAG